MRRGQRAFWPDNKEKEKRKCIYYASIVSKGSDMDQTVLPANKQCLPFLRKRSQDGATVN